MSNKHCIKIKFLTKRNESRALGNGQCMADGFPVVVVLKELREKGKKVLSEPIYKQFSVLLAYDFYCCMAPDHHYCFEQRCLSIQL